jgi:hypothetical protein
VHVTVALFLALLHVASGTTLEGFVRSSDGDAPVPSAQVEVVVDDASGARVRAYTDSTGRYALSELKPGTYHVRVSAVGYEPREMDVFIAAAPRVQVDVVLIPHAVRLAEVRVRGAAMRAERDDSIAATLADRDVGTVVVSGNALHADPSLASADVLQTVAARGGASMRDEAPTAMHVHGAGAGENGVQLDGIPLFNPYHASGTLTALDPDIISTATLHAGAMDASLGDATGSTIELETSPADSGRLTTQGAYTARAFRESATGPLSAIGGSFLVAVRRSADAPLSDFRDHSSTGVEFGDLFARVTARLGGGELEAFAFHSDDRLGFDAGSEERSTSVALAEQLPAAPRTPNALAWTTGTDALRWRSSGPTRWEMRAWRTRFDASFGWSGSTRLASTLENLGASASAAWQQGGVHLAAGVDANRLDVRYDVASASDSAGVPLSLTGAPMVVSAFGEARWLAGERWSFAAGLRDALVAPGDHGVEPRVSMRFAPSHRVSLGLGYTRLHQYVQSMRNDESLVDALAGISLPAVAGSSANGTTVPVARADQLTASLDARLSPTLAFSATAYARRAQGLVLVAPISGQPFATTAFAAGTSRAEGMTLSLEHTGERVTGDLAYTLSSVSRRAGAASYLPDFAATQAIALGVGVRVWPSTTLRAAVAANSGTPASVFADQVEWTPYTPSSGSGDISGSPQRIVGSLNGAQLPAYVRFDVGVRREWGLHLFGHVAQIAGNATVTNVFGRGNAVGLVAAPTGSLLHPLLLPARSVELGFEWKH